MSTFFHIHTNIYCLWPESHAPSSQTTPPPIPQVPAAWTQGLGEAAPPLITLKINTRVSAQPRFVFDSTVDSALIQWRYHLSHFNIYSVNPQSLHVSAQTLLTAPEIPQHRQSVSHGWQVTPVLRTGHEKPGQADLLPDASALTHMALPKTRAQRTWRLLMPGQSCFPHPQCHTSTGRAELSSAASLLLCRAGTRFVALLLQWKGNTVRGHWQSS